MTRVLFRSFLALAGPEMVASDCIRWIAALTFNKRAHGTAAEHEANVAGCINA